MKKIFFLFLVILACLTSNACEICGCGLGNYYIGIMPHFSNKFIGVRYQFHSFRTRLNDDPSEFSKDLYQTIELWSGWNLGKKFQLLTFIPFNFNHQVSDEGTTDLKGFGDIAVLLNYKLLDKADKNIAQQLWIGTGLKLPTGKFEIEPGDPDVASLANTQRGSGSTDIMFNAMYNLKIDKWGFNANAGYKVNSNNKDDYQFGDKFSANTFVHYSISSKNIGVMPNAGILYEHTGSSKLSSEKIELTGGYLLQAVMGVELGFNKMAVGLNAQLPLSQNFAEGQTKSKVKGMVHVTFAI